MIDLPHHIARDLPPWTLTARTALSSEMTISGIEACDLAAAIELDRVQRGDAMALLSGRRVSPQALSWRALMDGAEGLRREHARGDLTVAAALERVGIEMVRVEVCGPVDMHDVKRGLRAAGGAR